MAQKLKTEISIDLAGNLSDKAKRYGNSMSDFAKKSDKAMAMLNQSVRAASRGIDSLGNRTIVGLGAAGFAFERTFIKTAANFETLAASMQSIMGSESGAASALGWIEDFTQSTPYALDEVTQSFIRLKAYGLDPMDGTMQAIADQASKMGGSAEQVEGIATALGQAWTKGKLQAEEMNQMLERGVPVYEYLQKASKDLGKNFGKGFSTAQIQDMASKGQLTRSAIQDLIRVMGEETKGSAELQMKTWNGMISNMGDHWSLFQKDVMNSGTFDLLKDELGEFLGMLEQMKSTGEYDELVETVGQNLVDSFRTAAEAAQGLKDVGDGLLPILKAVGTGAQAISDAVGGYGNLAKILASVYALNKAISISAPILKGGAAAGGWIYDKASGKKKGHGALASGLSSLSATPVFVTNWPSGGGFGAPMIPDLSPDSNNPKSRKANKFGKVIDIAGEAFAVGFAMEALFGDTEIAQKMKKTTLADVFPSVFDSNTKESETTGDKLRKQIEQQLPAYVTGNYNQFQPQSNYPMGGDLRVKVDVSDNRVETSIETSSPSIKVDPDTGVN